MLWAGVAACAAYTRFVAARGCENNAMDDNTNTHELLSRYLSGKIQAGTRLFEKLGAEMRAQLSRHPKWRYLRAYTCSEDVVQEVFARVFASGLLHKVEDRGRGSAAVLFATILDRTLVDHLRRRGAAKRRDVGAPQTQRIQEPGATTWQSTLADDGTTPTENACARDLIEFCRRHLSAREWAAWEAVEIRGLSAEEAARIEGTNASAVRGVLFRARARIGQLLSGGLADGRGAG